MNAKQFRMRGCHARLFRTLTLQEIARALSALGLEPVFRSARALISDRLSPLGIPVPLSFFNMGKMEVFASQSRDQAVLVKMDYSHAPEGVHVLDVLLVTAVTTRDAAIQGGDIARVLGVSLADYSWSEAFSIENLRGKLGELSPNGKKLADPSVREATRRYYDDDVRRTEKPLDGLWLESLAADVVAERTKAFWAGQMIGQDEFDTLAVFANQTIMIECKDSGLGQNEVYVADAKAERVGANAVIFLGTENIHPNAQKVLDEVRARRKAREFVVISECRAPDLRSKLECALDGMARGCVKHWMTGEASDSDYLARLLERGWFSNEFHPLE